MPAVYRLCGDDKNGRKTQLDALVRRPRALLEITLVVVGVGMVAQVAAQQPAGDYATDLGVVYAGYQRILALKEACDEAAPETRAANARAFSEWESRHAGLLSELKKRVSEMIRRASSDERDYARKLGKYEGAILLSREEQKIIFLTKGADTLKTRCRQAPQLLKGPDGDLTIVFSNELKTLRNRK